MFKTQLLVAKQPYCDVCGEECVSSFTELTTPGGVLHGCSEYDDEAEKFHRDILSDRFHSGDLKAQTLEPALDVTRLIDFLTAGGSASVSSADKAKLIELLNRAE